VAHKFDVYSWDTWFKSLTLKQLRDVRDAWSRAAARSKGFEREVLEWDIGQVGQAIMQREDTIPR